jgi:hypothetical protein
MVSTTGVTVNAQELHDAFDFVSASSPLENEAYFALIPEGYIGAWI